MLSKNNMTLKTVFILLFFSITIYPNSYGQTREIIPKEFVETIQPKLETEEWYSLNHSQNEFSVKVVKGQLEIEKVKTESKCELKIQGGTLIGINKGEFGGQLIFQPNDITKKAVKISRGNISFIFNYKDKIYFITSYAHQVFSTGGLFELERINNDFIFKLLVDFEDAPFAFTIYNDTFLVATFENFYKIKDFKKELIFKNTFWYGLYPNSIAVLNDKNIFIGMRSGIAKVDLTKRTLKFYKNDK
jgi:hypothetical protein